MTTLLNPAAWVRGFGEAFTRDIAVRTHLLLTVLCLLLGQVTEWWGYGAFFFGTLFLQSLVEYRHGPDAFPALLLALLAIGAVVTLFTGRIPLLGTMVL